MNRIGGKLRFHFESLKRILRAPKRRALYIYAIGAPITSDNKKQTLQVDIIRIRIELERQVARDFMPLYVTFVHF